MERLCPDDSHRSPTEPCGLSCVEFIRWLQLTMFGCYTSSDAHWNQRVPAADEVPVTLPSVQMHFALRGLSLLLRDATRCPKFEQLPNEQQSDRFAPGRDRLP